MLLLSLHESPLHATDTLTVTQPLSGDRKLISQNGSFALGFFQPTGEPFFFPFFVSAAGHTYHCCMDR